MTRLNEQAAPASTKYLTSISSRLERKLTVPEQVAEALRELILNGELGPGEAVVESQLARQLRVGQPTVREALKVLETEGLIERHLNRGCTVMRLQPEDLNQIYFLRRQWEPLAIDLAMASWSPAKTEALSGALAALQHAAEAADARRYHQADLRFHETLWALSDNRFLQKALRHIVLPMFAFLVVRKQGENPHRLDTNFAKHRAIVEAMCSGDGARARAALVDSLANSTS